MAALVASACAQPPSPTVNASTDELIIGVPEGDTEDQESGVGYLSNQITLEGLTQLGIEGRARPRLATSWTWENDQQRLRLQLRNDVLLHDGRQFDAQLAAEALAIAIAKPSVRAQYPALTDVVAAIPDGRHGLILELSSRSSLLPEDLTVLLDYPAGPYRPVRRTGDEAEGESDGESIRFERFPQYYRGAPAISTVVLRTFPTLRTAWASLLRDELDMVYDVPPDTVEFIRNDNIEVVAVPRWYQFLIAFNSQRPPFDSPAVRRALNVAVNRQELVDDVLSGRAVPSTGPLWPRYWAYDNTVTGFAYDPVQAAALLDQAGFSEMKSGGPGRPPARFRIVCLIPENFAVWERVGLQVQRDLYNVGVDLQFRVVPYLKYNELIGTGDFDAVLIDIISGPTPARPYMLWRSADRFRGVYNVFGYENAEAERLFDVLRTSTTEVAVRSATHRLQRVMLDDPPALFLAWSERARAISRDIQVPESEGYDLMWSLWNWSRTGLRTRVAE